MRLLVTNDDGVSAEGIDVLTQALLGLDDVSLTIVAPADNQTGAGDQTTPGGAASSPAATASGVEATAVSGYPADCVLVALDEQGLEPDLVIAGINFGQNVGPLAESSGTVGAARTAARRGYPAVSVSQGLGLPADYATGAMVALAWFSDHRAEIEAGTLPTDCLVSINIPTCTAGELRGTVTVPLAQGVDSLTALGPSNCASTLTDPADDYEAFANGFAAITDVPLQ